MESIYLFLGGSYDSVLINSCYVGIGFRVVWFFDFLREKEMFDLFMNFLIFRMVLVEKVNRLNNIYGS